MTTLSLKALSLVVLFGFLAITSNTANAQTASPSNPSGAWEYDTDCAHKVQETCSGEFGNWFPVDSNYSKEITLPNNDCKFTVFYQIRRCSTNIDIAEVKINLCLFDGANPDCSFIKEWSENLYDKNPGESEGMLEWTTWAIFAALTKAIVREGVDHWIEVGNTYPIPFCGKPDDGPNSPPTFILAGKGVCRGWCVVQNPSQPAIFEKYNVDLSDFPTPGYSTSELASMNDFIQKEVNPNLTPEGGKPFLPITDAGRARFVIKEYSCELDYCCYSTMKYCVDSLKPDGSYILREEFYSGTEWYDPSCEAKNIEEYCDKNDGELIYTFPCKAQCEYDDSIISRDSTEFPTPLTEGGITRVSVAPNPVDDVTTLTLAASEDGNLNIILLNLQGNKVLELHNGPIKTGEFTKTFSMKDMPPGIYFLQITFNDTVKMHPIIKDF